MCNKLNWSTGYKRNSTQIEMFECEMNMNLLLIYTPLSLYLNYFFVSGVLFNGCSILTIVKH